MLATCLAFAGNFRGGFDGHGMFFGNSGLWMIGFAIVRLLIFALLVFLIIKFIAPKFRTSHSVANTNNTNAVSEALQILNARYAKGELETETYLIMKDNLLK